jgi:predicted peptidase
MFVTVKIKKYLMLLLVLCVSNVNFAQNQKLFKYEHFINQTDTLNYRILLPKQFDGTKQYPLVLFLHGAGERGSDNAKQLVHGSSLFAKRKHRRKFPAIVILPQCPQNDYWANAIIDRTTNPYTMDFPLDSLPTKSLNLVMQLMDEMASKPFVKTDQIYVGGLSMGGMGTFEILYRKPTLFAAAFAICGGGNIETASQYAKNTPLWVFHGANDDIVDPQLSIEMVSAYLKAGGKPNFSLYSNDNHNSWDSAFAEPKLLPWLFSKSKL